MLEKISEKVSQTLTNVIQPPQTSIPTAGGTISVGAAEKLDYIGGVGSTVGIFVGVALTSFLIFVQAVKLKHYLVDRQVRIKSKAAHDNLIHQKLELEIKNLQRTYDG